MKLNTNAILSAAIGGLAAMVIYQLAIAGRVQKYQARKRIEKGVAK